MRIGIIRHFKVNHHKGLFMYSLQKELKKRGFIGKFIYTPKNGVLYLHKRE